MNHLLINLRHKISVRKILSLIVAAALIFNTMPVSAAENDLFTDSALNEADRTISEDGNGSDNTGSDVESADEVSDGVSSGDSGNGVMAEDETDQTIVKDYRVVSFKPLAEDVANQSVDFGTALENLLLPDGLDAIISNGEDEIDAAIEGVTWQSEPEFAAMTVGTLEYVPVGTYVFTPRLPEGFDLAEGVELPVITVEVQPLMAVPMVASSNVTWDGGTQGAQTLTDCVVTVTGTVTLTGTLTCSGTVVFTGGGVLQRSSGFKGNLITSSSGGSLTLESITIDGNGSNVTATTSSINISGGTLVMESGATIQNCKDSGGASGGAVNLGGTANFTMNGGKITNNESNHHGGAIYIESGSVYTMNGGEVTNNSISDINQYGGGGIYNKGTCNINGGEISGNSGGSVSNNSGGGIYNASSAILKINGGTIKNNQATKGEGVFHSARAGTTALLQIGGSADIQDKIYLDVTNTSKYVVFTSEIKHAVTLVIPEPVAEGRVIGEGTVSYALTKVDMQKISTIIANGQWYPKLTEDNKFVLTATDPGCSNYYYVSYNSNGGSGVVTDDTDYTAGGIITLKSGTTLSNPGYSFGGWQYNGTTYQSGASFTMPASNVTFTAVWTLTPTYGITLDQSGTYTFTAASYGYTGQTPLTVKVTNTGNQSTGTLTVALSGANGSSFTLSAASIPGIAVGGSGNFTVVPNTGLAAGTYTATVTVSGSNGILASFSVIFTVNKVNQTAFSVTNPGTKTYGDPDFTLSSSGGSGSGAVSYVVVSGPGTVTSGGKLTITGVGSIIVKATKEGDGNYNAQTSGNLTIEVAQKQLSWTSGTVSNKTYDGTTAATVSTAPALSGIISEDESDVTVVPGTVQFDGANVGTRAVTASGYGISGPKAGNYIAPASEPSFASAAISSAALTITGFTITKIYDGNNGVTGFGTLSFAGLKNGETADVSAAGVTAIYNNANTGTGKQITFNGSLTMTGGTALATNYTITQPAGITGSIAAAAGTVTFPSAGSVTYGQTLSSSMLSGGTGNGSFAWKGSSIFPTVTNSGYDVVFTPADTVNYDYSGITGWDGTAGTITQKVSVKVNPRNISNTVISSIPDQTYTGSGITPTPGVSDSGATITSGDYDVSYIANINAGTATVTLTGKGNYTGTTTAAFTIKPRAITLTIDPIGDETYTGSRITPVVTVKDGSKTLVEGRDYEVVYSENITAGTVEVTVTGIGNYLGSGGVTEFEIIPKEISFTVEEISDRTYMGSELTPAVTVKDQDNTLALGTDYTVAYSDNINAGTANVTVTGMGNYLGSTGSTTFTIMKAVLTPAVDFTNAENKIYDGSLKVGGFPAIVLTGAVAGEAPEATADFVFLDPDVGKNKTVNVENITLSGDWGNNYTLSTDTVKGVVSNLSVMRKYISIDTITAPVKSYDGNQTAPAGEVTFSGLAAGETLILGIDYNVTCSFTDNANAGDTKSYTCVVTILGTDKTDNYALLVYTMSGDDGTINKSEYDVEKITTAEVRPGSVTSDGTLELPQLPPGAVYASAGTVGGSADLISDYSISGTTLTYSTTGQPVGTQSHITISVTGATNYLDYEVAVKITAREYTNGEKAEEDAAALDFDIIKSGNSVADNIKDDLDLFSSGSEHGSVITWESSDTLVIDIDGTVTRPKHNEGDKAVTLTATVGEDQDSEKVELNLTVKALVVTDITIRSYPEMLDYVNGDTLDLTGLVVTLTFDDGSTADVKLSDFETNLITVSPENSALLDRTNDNMPVTVIYNNSETLRAITDNNLTVDLNDAEKSAEDAAALDYSSIMDGNTDKDNITGSLDLPSAGSIHGSDITWQSDNTTVIDNTGNVTQPSHTQGDQTVNLTATVDYNGVKETVELTVIVKALGPNNEEKVKEDVDTLTFDTIRNGNTDNYNITGDLLLTGQGSVYGSDITWQSSDPSVIGNDGTVTRPSHEEGDKTVTLTATIDQNGVTRTVTMTVTVKSETAPADDKGGVSGIITDSSNDPLSGIRVSVKTGGTSGLTMGSTRTGATGSYSFSGLPYGVYSLVAESDGVTVTKLIVIKRKNMIQDIEMPPGNQNTYIEVKGSDTPSVAVENLEEMFTAQDMAAALTGTVEIRLVVEAVTDPADADLITVYLGDKSLGLYLDMRLLKTITGTANDCTDERIQPPDGTLLKIVIDVPTELQNMAPYSILRVHEGDVAVIPAIYDPELHTLTFETDRFSTYALVYTQADTGSSEPSSSEGSLPNDEGDNNTGTKSGKDNEPATGDRTLPIATIAMIGGLAYLMELFLNKKGAGRFRMTEAQKNRILEIIIRNAKKYGKPTRLLALGMIFVILVFYYSIGKIVEFEPNQLA